MQYRFHPFNIFFYHIIWETTFLRKFCRRPQIVILIDSLDIHCQLRSALNQKLIPISNSEGFVHITHHPFMWMSRDRGCKKSQVWAQYRKCNSNGFPHLLQKKIKCIKLLVRTIMEIRYSNITGRAATLHKLPEYIKA